MKWYNKKYNFELLYFTDILIRGVIITADDTPENSGDTVSLDRQGVSQQGDAAMSSRHGVFSGITTDSLCKICLLVLLGLNLTEGELVALL